MYKYLDVFRTSPNNPRLPRSDIREDWEYSHAIWLIRRWLEDEDRFDLGAIVGEFCEAKDGFLNSVLAKGVNKSNQIIVDALTAKIRASKQYERHFYGDMLVDVI